MNDDPDRYIVGLKPLTPFTLSGEWPSEGVEDVFTKLDDVRQVRLTFHSRVLFGVEWWTRRETFHARTVTHHDGDEVTMQFYIVSPILVERAAWWRRAGHALVRWLPTWKVHDDDQS